MELKKSLLQLSLGIFELISAVVQIHIQTIENISNGGSWCFTGRVDLYAI
ncbi:hypothetical protein HanRHA438_Chr09g0413151 [Helianthus annuus]|nr:hypothetical protein HanRHA438_Chr09g0413151 [Helianthus annuus]